MITAVCHCGAVALEIAEAPTEVTDCTCSICRRYGALWAYYPLDQVRLVPPAAATDTYMWDDRSIAFHRCRTCGCVTHWSPVDPARNRMGVNARLIPTADLAQARVRHLDGGVTERYLD
ncbi:GFA family protein [Phenylobacterium aquaticum]|uniref:GFA family protein n=1 Tax=Phenylobacterium aquaticum TaxID=1763816 RepID=UPI001F5C725C|nr:GFA family protein [Phenylobacterium aquaticum]MCI3135542.1 GFA family protein [Phenylobacterium aquaticum]